MSIFHLSKKVDGLTMILVMDDSYMEGVLFERSDKAISIIQILSLAIPKHPAGREKISDSLFTGILNKLLHEIGKKPRKSDGVNRDNLLSVNAIHCFYSEPFSLTRLLECRKDADKPFILTSEIVKSIFAEKEEQFIAEIENGKEKLAKGQGSADLIEKKIVMTEINGYPVKNFISREATSFNAATIHSALRSGLRQKVGEIIKSRFHNAEIYTHTLDLAIFTELSDLLPGISNYLYCLIMPSRTTVTYVKNGIPSDSSYFEFGSEKISKEFNSKMSLAKEVADSYIKLYRENKLHGTTALHVAKTIETIATGWSQELLVAISKICKEIVPPKFMFIIPRDEYSLALSDHVAVDNAVAPSLSSQFSIDTVDNKKINGLKLAGNITSLMPFFLVLAKYASR